LFTLLPFVHLRSVALRLLYVHCCCSTFTPLVVVAFVVTVVTFTVVVLGCWFPVVVGCVCLLRLLLLDICLVVTFVVVVVPLRSLLFVCLRFDLFIVVVHLHTVHIVVVGLVGCCWFRLPDCYVVCIWCCCCSVVVYVCLTLPVFVTFYPLRLSQFGCCCCVGWLLAFV